MEPSDEGGRKVPLPSKKGQRRKGSGVIPESHQRGWCVLELLVFFYFASVIIATSVFVVLLKNPIYNVLALLIMFFHVAGLYVTLYAEFLAIVQIMVYAGAILVLYLFVVMLLNMKSDQHYHSKFIVGTGFISLLLLEGALLFVSRNSTPQQSIQVEPGSLSTTGNTQAIGEVLYSTYLFPFEVASLILLVAMIGAIILAKKDLFEDKSKKEVNTQ